MTLVQNIFPFLDLLFKSVGPSKALDTQILMIDWYWSISVYRGISPIYNDSIYK